MKIKIEVELDTESTEDKKLIEQIIVLLEDIKGKLEGDADD